MREFSLLNTCGYVQMRVRACVVVCGGIELARPKCVVIIVAFHEAFPGDVAPLSYLYSNLTSPS